MDDPLCLLATATLVWELIYPELCRWDSSRWWIKSRPCGGLFCKMVQKLVPSTQCLKKKTCGLTSDATLLPRRAPLLRVSRWNLSSAINSLVQSSMTTFEFDTGMACRRGQQQVFCLRKFTKSDESHLQILHWISCNTFPHLLAWQSKYEIQKCTS